MPELNRKQFGVEHSEQDGYHVVRAVHRGTELGRLTYTSSSAEGVDVDHVETHPGYGRRGVASALVGHVAQRHPGPLATAWFSDEGEGFARKWNGAHPKTPLEGYSGWRPGLNDREHGY